jgi:hypothetical protein
MVGYHTVQVKGQLDESWSDSQGRVMSNESNRDAGLAESIVDQAALHGLLAKVRDLGLPLLPVFQIEADDES